MADTPLHYLTIREASGLIQRGELSPVELTEAFLRRIEAVDHRLRAYVTVTADQARAEARAGGDGSGPGRVPRPPARHSRGLQGPVRHGGCAHHRFLEAAGAPGTHR